jgi:hypothetical protein
MVTFCEIQRLWAPSTAVSTGRPMTTTASVTRNNGDERKTYGVAVSHPDPLLVLVLDTLVTEPVGTFS